jgi:hypothetical protein
MASYNHDKFREFVNSPSFQKTFDLTDEIMADLNSDDVILMHFGIDFLKQVLFGEMTIPLRDGAAEQRVAERKEKVAERNKLKEEVARAQKDVYEQDQERDEALGDNLGCTDGECRTEG